MRILLLTPLNLAADLSPSQTRLHSHTGLPYYQAQNFWFDALISLGHQVQTFTYSGPHPQLDYYSWLTDRATSRLPFALKTLRTLGSFLPSLHRRQIQLLKLAATFKPQLIIFSGNTDLILPETLLTIKQLYSTKLVLLNGLSPVVSATHTERQLAPHFDYIFTNDHYHAIDWQMLGAPQAISLPVSAINLDFHHPYPITPSEKKSLSSQISFVGSLSHSPLYPDRWQLLTSLSDLNLKIWSPNATEILASHQLSHCYAGRASAETMLKIFSSSAINLNFHGPTMPAGGNLRTFEIPSTNGFQIVDRTNPKWFKIDKEIVTFDSPTDLRQKILYYLKHPSHRLAIAAAGYRRVIRDHTYRHRFSKLLKLIKP